MVADYLLWLLNSVHICSLQLISTTPTFTSSGHVNMIQKKALDHLDLFFTKIFFSASLSQNVSTRCRSRSTTSASIARVSRGESTVDYPRRYLDVRCCSSSYHTSVPFYKLKLKERRKEEERKIK